MAKETCSETRNFLRLTPKDISSTPFPTLLLKSLPTKHHEIYGPYNTVCQFIKHMKYDKAELVEIEAVLKPTRKCDVCSTTTTKACGKLQNQLLLNPFLPENSLEEAQKVVQTPHLPSRHRG